MPVPGKIVFIHTVATLIPLFNDLTREYFRADTETVHIADEILLKEVLAKGGPTPFIQQRLIDHALAAQEIGASLIQVTCSSLSPCVEKAQSQIQIPILKIDAPMVQKAIETGKRIGILATAGTTLTPTTDLVRRKAAQSGKEIEVVSLLCEGAYAALGQGDLPLHNRIILDYIHQLEKQVDIILLAQASMARAITDLPASEEPSIPILTSPKLAMQYAASVLEKGGKVMH
jgi:aspartate/glutamate racemase